MARSPLFDLAHSEADRQRVEDALRASVRTNDKYLTEIASHLVVAAVVMRGYSPGLASAVLINAPISVYLFRRAARERWLPRTAWRALWPAALLVHGPGLVGLLLLTRVGS